MPAKKVSKPTDFLCISGRIKSKEIRLVDNATVEKMIEATDIMEILKLLGECGYDVGGLNGAEKDLATQLIEKSRAETAEAISQAGHGLFDCFLYPNDYLNLKVALKNELLADPRDIYVKGGSVSVDELKEAVVRRELAPLTEAMRAGVLEATELCSKTGNSQYIDIVLDRYCFVDMARAARETGNGFLEGYVRTYINVANVKALLRLRKMGKPVEFAAEVFFDGGTLPAERYAQVYDVPEEQLPNQLSAISGLVSRAIEDLAKGGMSEFERYCDSYLMDYVRTARYIPYGAEVPMAYLLAKEAEYKAISMIVTGRQTELPAQAIKERMRALYV